MIVLHGRKCQTTPLTTQDYGWKYTSGLAGNGFLVVMPSATSATYSRNGCTAGTPLWMWNWFGACELGQFGTQPCPDDSGFLGALKQELVANYGVDPNRVYVHGFSAGAHMAYRVAVEHGDQFRGVSINSGLPETGFSDGNIFSIVPQSIVGQTSLIIVHGTADTTAGGVNPCSGTWSKSASVAASTIDGAFNYFVGLQSWTASSQQPLCNSGILGIAGNTATDSFGVQKLEVIPVPGGGHTALTQYNRYIWNKWAAQI